MGSGLTCVGYGWSLLSFLAACSVSAGYYLPMWLVGYLKDADGNLFPAYFGSFRRCNYPQMDENQSRSKIMLQCGRYRTFDDIPSIWWQVCTVTVGVGTILAILVAFIIVPACIIKDIVSRTSARLLGIVQVLAAILIGVGCILYPLGWDNREAKEACNGRSGAYMLGSCRIGWAYYLVLGGAMLLLICASLSTKAGHSVRWRKVPTQSGGANLMDHEPLKANA